MSGKSKAREAAEADLAASRALAPLAFSSAIAKRVKEFAMLGADNDTIAGFIGVPLPTFERWLVDNPKMRRALSDGRENGGVRMVRALVQRGVGFRAKAQKVVMVDGKPQVVEYKEYYPPDVQAQRYYLNNKHPKQWQERTGPEAGAVLDLAALVKALHANRGDDAKVIEGEATEEPDTP